MDISQYEIYIMASLQILLYTFFIPAQSVADLAVALDENVLVHGSNFDIFFFQLKSRILKLHKIITPII